MDFYIVLGLERGATVNDIKRAYKRLARKHHPDINPGDRLAAQKFQQIAEAYETLSDPERRRRYDISGVDSAGVGTPTFGFDGFDFTVSVQGHDAPTFGDLFADVLQQREARRANGDAVRGVDLHHTVTLEFEDAIAGGQRAITLMRQERCHVCHGAGRLPAAETRCIHCHGAGVVKSARGHMVFSKPCAQCGGAGAQRQARCPACGGQQVEMQTERLTINIPPGLADGARIRVVGKGHVGRNGGANGDLYVSVQVRPHPVFTRDGDDLHLVVPIAVHEAALGAKVDVPALEGTARLRVPPGTQSGQKFRLRERGVPSARDGRRGDLVVEVRLVLPKSLDERSKELLREFGKLNPEDARQELNHHKGH